MITLPASLQSLLTIGGVNIESDASASVVDIAVDFVTKTALLTIKQGTTAGQVFTPGTITSTNIFHINLITGAWTCEGSAITGTLSGAGLTSIQTTFLNLRNLGETFAVNQNLFPGASAPTAWTQI